MFDLVSGTDDKATEEFLNALEEWNPTVSFFLLSFCDSLTH
jgi:hypothetical protein